MTQPGAKTPFVAIACGGTGGHLFPGLAVAGELKKRGCQTALLISPKDIDQQAVKTARDAEIFTLPAVGLQNRNYFSFAGSFVKSWFAARKIFRRNPPDAVLAMGGFTSAPPVLAAKRFGARTFLHESNTVPGRANRFLARFVDEAFVGFPETASRLRVRKVTRTGTPVRPQFSMEQDSVEPKSRPCRTALGLEAQRPTILVMGGSQGASGINDIILAALPLLARRHSTWQWLHLTGAAQFERVKAAYATSGIKAVVSPFLAEMDLALGAATVAVSRAGASSLAEIAAMRLPSLLVPFPAAADNHQFHNARAFEATGAARLLEQESATPEKVAAILRDLAENAAARAAMQSALAPWHAPRAAEKIAENILSACRSSSLSLPTANRLEPELQSPRSGEPRQEHDCAA
ncbi:MAG TPA: undecaprenyldiphospho-muramoylpentapeptide beta-N-acetylglucosaminyltransferase [Verrucomicrobiae bacterium]|nr:undecaprenyldiphospho-muramoylpentapeptide beta-N-acetylglucosaminyltransferase [Verrucomicrobiae bacterium]